MAAARSFLAGLALIVSAIVLLLSLAVGVGVWIIKQPVTDRTTLVFQKIDASLEIARQGLQETRVSLDRASQRLESVAAQQRAEASQPQRSLSVSRTLARSVQRQFTPDLQATQDKLQTVAEASLVINTVLSDLAHFPLFQSSRLDTERLTEMNRQISQVGPAAWELSRLLGDGGTDPGAEAELTRMMRTLDTVRGLIAQYEPQVVRVRQQTEALRTEVFRWITAAVVLISFLSFWIAFSQVCLMRQVWKWRKIPSTTMAAKQATP